MAFKRLLVSATAACMAQRTLVHRQLASDARQSQLTKPSMCSMFYQPRCCLADVQTLCHETTWRVSVCMPWRGLSCLLPVVATGTNSCNFVSSAIR